MYTLGIDIGSTTSKCAILKDGKDLIATSLVVGGMGTPGPDEAVRQVFEKSGLKREDMAMTIATGYGRTRYKGSDMDMSELSCHAMGAHHVFPTVRTVIDIGGQDAKLISLDERGRMKDFLMNDKCAAGTGRFLDVMANILQLDVNRFCGKRGYQPAGQRRHHPESGGGHLRLRFQPRGRPGQAHRADPRHLHERRRRPERRRAQLHGKRTGHQDPGFPDGAAVRRPGRGVLRVREGAQVKFVFPMQRHT